MADPLEDKSNENQRLRCLTKFLPPTGGMGILAGMKTTSKLLYAGAGLATLLALVRLAGRQCSEANQTPSD